VLFYLAGRRGSAARQEALQPDDEENLLRLLREDLRAAHGTEPNDYDYMGCKVQKISQDGEGKTVVTVDPRLTAVFCPGFVPTRVETGAGARGR
jgi:hypothetical protein